MSQDDIRLPRSSFDEVKKILKGYAHLGENISLDAAAKLLGMNKSVVSGNNPFLASIGLLEGSRVKNLTPLGAKLARAIQHARQEDTKKYLQEVVANSEFLSNLISTVRIKNGMTEDDLVSHILYVSDQNPNKRNKTGSRTIVDLLLESGLLEQKDGKIVVSSVETLDVVRNSESSAPEIYEREQPVQDKTTLSAEQAPKQKKGVNVITTPTPTIAINIQLQIPATENAAVYENLFKALRENLIEPSLYDETE